MFLEFQITREVCEKYLFALVFAVYQIEIRLLVIIYSYGVK